MAGVAQDPNRLAERNTLKRAKLLSEKLFKNVILHQGFILCASAEGCKLYFCTETEKCEV